MNVNGLTGLFGRPAEALRVAVVALAALAALADSAGAQVIPPTEQPGRERERFIEPRGPSAQPGGPAISLPSTEAPPGAAETMVTIRRVRIVGSTVYRTEDFAPLIGNLVGRRVALQALYDLARQVTAKYGNDGYVLTRAIVPPQELDPSGASVRIDVIEGFVNRVQWPEKLKQYRDFFTHYEAKIVADRPLNVRTLERYLLLANDLPGLRFKTSLKASPRERGAATLVVEIEEKALDVGVRMDNRGTKARGPYQFLTSFTFNNLLRNHGAMTIAYAGVTQLRELQFVAPSYRQVLNAEGLALFVNASHSWGKPGTAQLRVLEFETEGSWGEAGLSYPIIRTRERNLSFAALAFMSDNTSHVLQTKFNVDRLRGVRARMEGDFADRFGGINQVNLTVSQGIDGLGSTEQGQPLASRAAGKPDFSKAELYLSRLQPLGGPFSALIAAYGQYAFTSLLSPEQCGFGGRSFGRAFDPSELLGDRCWEVSAELRYDLAAPARHLPSAQFYGFVDKGHVKTISPAVGTAGSVSGASAGGGVRLGWQNYFVADLSAAKGIEGPRNDWRFFFIATARY